MSPRPRQGHKILGSQDFDLYTLRGFNESSFKFFVDLVQNNPFTWLQAEHF